jgi:CelD/BcsL family acetyltransferase involved in cellulose biosynthesis
MIASAIKKKTVKKFSSAGNQAIELLVGEEALSLLKDASFLNKWDHLHSRCSWATIFQSSSFVATWYRIYEAAFLPIVAKTEDAGKLTGLLTLAEDKNGLISGAGANQAEYQVWLTADAKDETFIKSALLEVHRHFPRKKIRLQYIPAGISLGWTREPIFHRCCFIKTSADPLMTIREPERTNELRKKNRREKINRLSRLGELKFERIRDYETFAAVFDELALQSDFRKGAMYNKVAFKTDPFKKKFLLAQFEQNNLHATVLKLNDTIIASNVSMRENNRLYLQGINSFAAPLARYSPGIIHFLLLGKLLAEEGVDVFDLTPGEDMYKGTLATDFTVAYTLSIGNSYHGFTNRFKSQVNNYLKNTASRIGVNIKTLKQLKRSFNDHKTKFMHAVKHGVTSLFLYFIHQMKWRRKITHHLAVRKHYTFSGPLLNVQKDNLKDLLDFDEQEIRYSVQEFLTDAMKRFEAGAHCYSWVEDSVLLACAWIAEPVDCSETGSDGISLSGIYCHPKARRRFSDFLQSIATKVSVDNYSDK